MPVDQLEIEDFWYIKEPLIVKHSINLLPVFLSLCGSDFFDF